MTVRPTRRANDARSRRRGRNVRYAAALAVSAMAAWAVPLPGMAPHALAQSGFDCAHGPDAYRVRGVAGWDMLNVRAGPSARNRVVGRLPPNAAGIRCVGPCEGSWCRIGWRNVSGWVNMRYLGE